MDGDMNRSMTRDNGTFAGINDTMGSTGGGKEAMDMEGSTDCGVPNLSGQWRIQAEQDPRLQQLVYKHEIRVSERNRLMVLVGYEIVVLCDDSGSMNLTVDDTNRTRWDELRRIVKLVVEIGTIFDKNGVDVYFLNRQGALGIKDPKDIDHFFTESPSGYTPLARVLREVIKSSKDHLKHQKKLLIFIATDGTPTDDDGNPDLANFKGVMVNERDANTTHVMFLLCTDEEECIDYLTRFKKTMRNVDVYDDYETEKKKPPKSGRDPVMLSRGDYIVQALVGAAEREN